MNDVIKALAVTVGTLIIGLASIIVARTVQAGDGEDFNPAESSYDMGDHVARVWAFCMGTTGVYLLGDTDGMEVLRDDPNCGPDGFLLTPHRGG